MSMPINLKYDSSSPSFATGPQTPVCLDWTLNPFNARVGVIIPAGSTANYSVEYCMDDVNGGATARWLPDPTLGPGQTASGVTAYSSPIQFLRVNIASLSGILETKILQGFTS